MNDINEMPTYYAVIPANVRYDKDLMTSAKLLYGEVTSLCNKTGYCWATNQYFANLYKVHYKTISKWVNLLVEKGYLYSEMIYKNNSKEVLQRALKLDNNIQIDIEEFYGKRSLTPIHQNVDTYPPKRGYPIHQNVEDNNTSINNINIKYKKEEINKEEKDFVSITFVPPAIEEVRNYCLDRNNNINPEIFINFYQSKGWMIGKNKMKDWKAGVRNWEQRNKKDMNNRKEVNYETI